MKKFLPIFLASLLIISNFQSYAKADSDLNFMENKDEKKVGGTKPNFLIMPSTNYNERPKGIKPSLIVLHHTAPFSSLAKVGYFFQDVNSRVSAHFTVGKEGLIIQSVDEKDRAWHAGPSTWLGEWNVNDYSLGIEILNDGDSKDPFTEPQYNAVVKLVSYLMKKYNIPISKVVGHRDIAIPMGRKIDPADNFDWKLVKSKIRKELDLSANLFGWGELPQENNEKLSVVLDNLKSTDENKRASGLELLFTVPHKNTDAIIESIFNNEKDEKLRARFYKFFEMEENPNFINQALDDIKSYNNNSELLNINLINYLAEVNFDKSKDILVKMYNDRKLSDNIKNNLVKVISRYKDNLVKNILLNSLEIVSNNQKKVILESLSNYNDKNLNTTLLNYIEESFSDDIKVSALESIRTTFDENVEKKLIILLPKLQNDVLDATTWCLLRKDSKNALKEIIKPSIFDNLSDKLKEGVLNTIAKLKYAEGESILIKNLEDENINDYVRYSSILALGKIDTEKGFSTLTKFFNQEQTKDTKIVLLRAIMESSQKDIVSKLIINALKSKNIHYEAKLAILSTIKEKKPTNLLPFLKEALVESRVEEFTNILKDTIAYIENG
ncbi:MAG: N-acetylmuramoyl-L-alanine amidase [Candidatus Sericytochromatia bacterium]